MLKTHQQVSTLLALYVHTWDSLARCNDLMDICGGGEGEGRSNRKMEETVHVAKSHISPV